MTSTLQFIDEAHASFYDLGRLALSGAPIDPAMALNLRHRMLPYMDLSDARIGSDFIDSMGGRERAELRKRSFVGLNRFVAWAMEYAAELDGRTGGVFAPISVYDPHCLYEVLFQLAVQHPSTRRDALKGHFSG